jgi:Na+-transporting NADH:ubiquinone oxidoreductase subunit B
VTHIQRQYLLASLPAALVGVWSIGDRVRSQAAEGADVLQLSLINSLQMSSESAGGVLVAAALGASFFLPLLFTVSITSRAWAEIFARARGRSIDEGWFLSAWLYVLLLPATLPLHYAALGFSFGAVFGCYVFGGTGRYVVNPALLGVAFISISYPDLFAQNHWLPGSDVLASWALVAAEGIEAAASRGTSWAALFLGTEIGALGTSSALAALLGASYLIARRIASAGIVVGALIGLAIAGAAGVHCHGSNDAAAHDRRLLGLRRPVRVPDRRSTHGRSGPSGSHRIRPAARESVCAAHRSHRKLHGTGRENSAGRRA